MKAAEAIKKLGLELQARYKPLGFKYTNFDKCLAKTTENFSYLVIMYSTRGNKEGIDVSLHTDFAISCYREGVSQLFYIRLLELEHTWYNIATDALITETITGLSEKIDELLIPFIDKLENNIEANRDKWVQYGFFKSRKGYGFVMNIPFINEFYGKDKAEECLYNYCQTLPPEHRQMFGGVLAGKTDIYSLPETFRRAQGYIIDKATALGLELKYNKDI